MEDFDNDHPRVAKKWPLPRFVRPGIRGMIQSSLVPLPELPPLDPKIIIDIQENGTKLGEITLSLSCLEKKSESICEELEGLEKTNRWHNRGNRDARIKQLNNELDEIKKKKETAKDSYNTLIKEAESAISIASLHASLEKSYEALEKLKFGLD